MCDTSKIPSLVTYEVEYENERGYTTDKIVDAQGYEPDPILDGFVRFWRYIPAGERQSAGSFPVSAIRSIVETRPDQQVTVPAVWSAAETVTPVAADDDVPF